MVRQAVFVVLIALLLGAAGDFRQRLMLDPDRARFFETCTYYDARAQIARQRHGNGQRAEFIGFLDQVCEAAQASYFNGPPVQQAHARQLLTRIEALRHTVNKLNAARRAQRERTRVTPWAEFLIAHRIGLMNAYDAWLDTGVEFSLASNP